MDLFLRHTKLVLLVEQLILLDISSILYKFACIILFNFQNDFESRVRSYQFTQREIEAQEVK